MRNKPTVGDSRTIDERVNETREAESPYQAIRYKRIPPEIIPEGMVYGWITCSSRNEEFIDNLSSSLGRGWKPVASSRHPKFTNYMNHLSLYPAAIRERYQEYILDVDQILCEMPKEDYHEHIENCNRQRDESYRVAFSGQDVNRGITPNQQMRGLTAEQAARYTQGPGAYMLNPQSHGPARPF